ncbi:MAG TPA: hypothetical protein VFX54_22330, partial [Candidatus Binatia bacterium]|nr:hypothetical protein [Candidatus Binatia bacterium]
KTALQIFFAIGTPPFLNLSESLTEDVRDPWFRNCDAIDPGLDYLCESKEQRHRYACEAVAT